MTRRAMIATWCERQPWFISAFPAQGQWERPFLHVVHRYNGEWSWEQITRLCFTEGEI
jgi:hypothetical protein